MKRPIDRWRVGNKNLSFDRDDGRDMRLPLRPGDRRPGIEHRDSAGLVTVAFFAVDRLRTGERLGVVANSLDLTAQSRLVVF